MSRAQWKYLSQTWAALEDERGGIVATVKQEELIWWLRCHPNGRGGWNTVRRIWPQVRGERWLTLAEVYARADRALRSMEKAERGT